MSDLLEAHRRACARFTEIAGGVRADQWAAPTPCSEWDARALVEHVIGFHEFLLLRPLGIRARRPRDDPAERWRVTAEALFAGLSTDMLDQPTDLPGGGQSTPGSMLAALTTDVLVHTWDLARAAGLSPGLDEHLCRQGYARARKSGVGRDSGMVGPEVPVPDDAPIDVKLVAFYGRDPAWSPTSR